MVDLLVIESLEDGRNFSTQEGAGCSVNARSGRHKLGADRADERSLQQLERQHS